MKKVMRRIATGVKMVAKKIEKRAMLAIGFAMAAPALAVAQSTEFNSGISQATEAISGSFDTVSTLMMAIGGVVGLVGAIRIFIKWNNGDQDVTKAILAWGGAALFLIVSSVILNAMFR